MMLKDLPKYEKLLELSRKYPDLNPTSTEAYLHLLRTGDELMRVSSSYFSRHNVSQGRFCVLMILMQEEVGKGLSPAELADMSNCTRATMTGLIDTLEKDGMVRREPDVTDRRMMRVAITEAGRNSVQNLLPDHFKRTTEIMSGLSEEECRTLVSLLGKVVEQANRVEPLSPSAPGHSCLH